MGIEDRSRGTVADGFRFSAGEPGLKRRLRQESERIASQHQKLGRLYADLHKDLRRGVRPSAVVSFSRMRDGLEAHFEIEDQLYFPAVRTYEGTLGSEVDALERDHREFRQDLEAMRWLVEGGELATALDSLRCFAARLLRHEDVEEALLRRTQV